MAQSFSVRVRNNAVEFLQHESAAEDVAKIVHFHQDGEIALFLIGRLYYREDLLNRIGVRNGSQRQHLRDTNPAELAIAAYRQWGPAAFTRLEGEFALCLWDRRQQVVIAARDAMGNYPLFWRQTGESLEISTSLRPLLQSGVPEIDFDYMADALASPFPYQEIPSQRTVYQGIQRLPDGSWLRVPTHRLDQVASVLRYWHWEDEVRDAPCTSEDELAGHFRAVLEEAVRQRMIGSVCAHVSGGIDSTALAMLAGAEHKRRGAGSRLCTLSVVYSRLTELAKERHYVDLALAHRDYFDPIFVNGDDMLDFSNFGDATPPHDEPYAGLWRSNMDGTIVDVARRAGCETMLSGIGADEIADLLPFHIADLIGNRRWLAGWRESGRWAHHFSMDHWNVFRTFGLQPSISGTRLGSAAKWLAGGGKSWQKLNEWSVAPWLRDNFSSQYQLPERIAQVLVPSGSSNHNQNVRSLLGMIRSRMGDNNRWIFGVPSGVHVAHPFLDTRVLRFGLSYQQHCRPEPGLKKPLITKAMGEDLPEAIRYRRSKGDFNEVMFLGLSRNLPTLLRLIEQSPLDQWGIVDKATLADCLQKAALGVANGMHGIQKMSITLALMKWQSQHLQWQSQWEANAATRCVFSVAATRVDADSSMISRCVA